MLSCSLSFSGCLRFCGKVLYELKSKTIPLPLVALESVAMFVDSVDTMVRSVLSFSMPISLLLIKSRGREGISVFRLFFLYGLGLEVLYCSDSFLKRGVASDCALR